METCFFLSFCHLIALNLAFLYLYHLCSQCPVSGKPRVDVFSYWLLTSTCKFKENISVSHPQRAKFLLSEIFWNLVIMDRFHHGACQNLRREKQGFEAYIIGYLIWTTTICKLYIRKEAGYQSRSHMGHIANQIICKVPEITQSRLLDCNGIKVEVTNRRIIRKCLNIGN